MLVFRVAQPYAFVGPHFWDMGINPQWKADMQREFNFQNGNVAYPPFIQFAGRTPFLTPLKTMVLWGTGPLLGLAAWIALAAGAVLLFKRRELTVPSAAFVRGRDLRRSRASGSLPSCATSRRCIRCCA